jgi:ABC-2 type transport system ATP-binding protein
MSHPLIKVENLSKTYRIPERTPGLKASIASLFNPRSVDVPAVVDLTFSIHPGEMVGFIGPNGAGKTTTLKMLSGLLYPTAGTASVFGFTPWDRQPRYLERISMVMGNRNQMIWDIPPLDSFRVIQQMYRVPEIEYRRTLDELIALLEMEELLNKPVRNLSLGERMKCELTGGLLYSPRVLFLDEPTLGLDVSMQRRLRRFLREYNQRHEVTVMLTSHYMADVAELCPRVILIHRGSIIYDGELNGLAEHLLPYKLIKIRLENGTSSPDRLLNIPAEIIEGENGVFTLRVSRKETAAVTAQVLEKLPVIDLVVEDPPIEAVIDKVYTEGRI